MRAVEMRVKAGTGLEFEHIVFGIERPDAGEGGVHVFGQRLCAFLEEIPQRLVRAECEADISADGGFARLVV